MALTVDVEGDPGKLGARLDWLLEAFATAGATATFFMLGEVAEAVPGLVGRLAGAGHEIGFHGYRHVPVGKLAPAEFGSQLVDWRRRLEDLAQRSVGGFRAPYFSIDRERAWALGIVAQAGFRYDSSINPGLSNRYGWIGAPRHPVRLGGSGLVLFPVPVLCALLPVAFSGGGYLRLLPWFLIHWGLQRHAQQGLPGMMYLHPWELDAGSKLAARWAATRGRSWMRARQARTSGAGRHRMGKRTEQLLAWNRGRLHSMGQIVDSLAVLPEWEPRPRNAQSKVDAQPGKYRRSSSACR